MQLVRRAKCEVLSALAVAALGLTAFGDTVLTQDEDWRGQESEKLTGTIDLKGHNLTISEFPASATITDTTAYTDLTVPGGAISVNLPEGGSESLVNLIDNDAAGRILLSGFKGCKINYDFGEGQPKVVRGFRFKAGNTSYSGRRPKSVAVYGTQDAVPDAAGRLSAPVPAEAVMFFANVVTDDGLVPALAKQIADMKPDWFCITLGQNTGYMCSPNATYERVFSAASAGSRRSAATM